jgi:hypothetical protein
MIGNVGNGDLEPHLSIRTLSVLTSNNPESSFDITRSLNGSFNPPTTADMPFAGRTTELKARHATKKIDESEKRILELDRAASPWRDINPIFAPPSLMKAFIQLATSLLVLIPYLLRKYQIPLVEFRIGLPLGLGINEIVTTAVTLQIH